MKSIYVISALFAWFLPMPGFGQVQFTPVPLTADGSIVSMTQDKYGFIWIANSGSGLYRYDGDQLKTYKPEANNDNAIISGRLETVYADKRGNLWIGSFGNGLDRFDYETETFTHFQRNSMNGSGLCSDSVRAILEDHEGTIWIGTAKGLDSLNASTGKFAHINIPSADGLVFSREHIRTIYQDKKGIIWIGCGSAFRDDEDDPAIGGLYRLDKKAMSLQRYLPKENDPTSLIDKRVRAIYEDSRGVFYVGTAGDGLHIMDRQKGIFQRCLYDSKNPNKLSRPAVRNVFTYAVDHITFINEDNLGAIWIGTFSGGINRYDPKTKSLEHYGVNAKANYATTRNEFWSFLKTKDNLLWISVWGPANIEQVFYKINTSQNRLAYKRIGKTAITYAESADGSLWIGTRHGIVRENRNGTYDTIFVEGRNEINSNIINYLEYHNNRLWVSTMGGLYQYDISNESFIAYRHDKNLQNSILSDTVLYTCQSNDGKLWAATSAGLDVMDVGKGSFSHYLHDPEDSSSISSNRVICIKEDDERNIWVGTQRGLNKIDRETGKFINYLEKRPTIQEIIKDTHGRIWVATFNYGIYLYDKQKDQFVQYRDSTGLINNINVYGLVYDKQDQLWLNTLLGFIRLDTEKKQAFLYGMSWKVNASINTNFGFYTSGGEVIFGDTAGYFHILTESNSGKKDIAPAPFLSKLFINNNVVVPGENSILAEPLQLTGSIKLQHDQNSFSIEFNNVDLLLNKADQNILYKLENFDNQWRSAAGQNTANYYNLPPGKYIFRVKAVNIYGNWGEHSIVMIIDPPWYKTWWAYLLLTLLALGMLRGYILYRSRSLRREKKMLEEKVVLRTQQLQKSLDDLKIAQSQLVQSEKMASLGELAAGIAHEIQNPLNFVNNFSEVSNELVDDLVNETDKGNAVEAKNISLQLKQNLEKVMHHGKRADAIVKGMLQHSQSSSGVKEPTDINALANEYLRLAYHGLRAKDKTFNATMKTEFDTSIGKINIIPQDIGRVLLNLYNNAFYAVSEKKSLIADGFEPMVTITTKLQYKDSNQVTKSAIRNPQSVIISVKDNGNGVPQKVLDKIFQPFFTTKPTGQGTGLGLSLSYDIVKAHGGELKVNTKEGEGSEFIIQLTN